MKVKLPWGVLPRASSGINWGHPRSRNLCFFAPLRDAYGATDLYSRQLFTTTGLGTRAFTKGGAGLLFGTSNYADFVQPSEIGPNTPFTIAWTQEARSTSSYSTILNVNFGTAGTHNGFLIYEGTVADVYRMSAGPQAVGGAHSWATAIGAVTNNRLDRFVLRAAAGSQSTTGSDFTLWRNGVLISRDSSSSFATNTSAGAKIGTRIGGTPDPWEGAILDMRMWARVLSDDEAARESTQEFVGELYTPQYLWAVPSTGGGTTYIITPTGGVVFGGNGSEVNTKVFAPSGGATFGGTGGMIFSSGGTTYTITPSGGVVMGGSATSTKGKIFLPSGGVTLGGTGLGLRTKIVSPSGGVTFSGTGNMTSNTAPVAANAGERTKVGAGT